MLTNIMEEIRREQQLFKPVWLCEHTEGEGLFAMIEDQRIRITVDYRRKIDDFTAMRICSAVGISWLCWSSKLKKYWLVKCDCGQYFIANHHHKRHCSDKCRAKSASNRQTDYRTKARAQRAAKLETLTCLWCKCDIQGKRLSKQFCSARCRQMASRRWR